MKTKKLFLLGTLVLASVSWVSEGSSLEQKTHEYLNQKIARMTINQGTINQFSLDSYLKNNLGFQKGTEEPLSGYSEVLKKQTKQEVFMWMGEGGIKEDDPDSFVGYLRTVAGLGRSNNHFHNPLGVLWKDSGLDNYLLVPSPSPPYFAILHYTGQSSILWAQNQNQDPGGKWSWYDARDYFYKGLTLTDKTQRDSAMANCFRAIGQLIHLIHDASVPAHVRNQIHVLFNYEKWVEKIRTGNADEQALFGQFIAKSTSFDPSILNLPVLDSSAPIPIANIIDTDKYSGSNPDVTAGTAIGMAEYANANFLSEGTIFRNFQYPSRNTSVDVEDQDISDPRGVQPSVKRPYYIKKRDGENTASNERLAQGKQGYRLATASFLYRYITDYFPVYMYKDKPGLDGGVYNDYAEKLLPWAVGYSAGLLQYFFRGNLRVDLLVPSIDKVTGADFGNRDDTGRNIDKVAIIIQNSSKWNGAIEPINPGDATPGTLTLIVSYKDISANRTIVQQADTYSITSIPDIESEYILPVLFTLAEPIPTEIAKEITYTLVYRGQLGQEKDAVIGKVIRAPVLQSVSPDQGIEGTVVTMTGDYLPEIEGPFPTTSRNVNFNHDMRWPYIAEVINRTDTEITAKVPNTAAIVKPGYGGLRVRRIIPETEEMIYSNPVPFFPIAEGEIRNSGGVLINATVEAVKPILGDYNHNQLPQRVMYSVPAGGSVLIQLMTGFTYNATANTSVTQDIWTITPDAVDFIFDLQ